ALHTFYRIISKSVLQLFSSIFAGSGVTEELSTKQKNSHFPLMSKDHEFQMRVDVAYGFFLT
ncbi:hypothetical protein V7087_17300, partial [Neobacillus niacini]|uniref:hypothetical protein n=1 Tax=Neobacillus niacini TaxID=86668 RepID=UPI003000C99B